MEWHDEKVSPTASGDGANQAGGDTVMPRGGARLTGLWATRPGKVRPAVLLWALGVPIPILLIIFLIRACTT